ncbi:hypothetical protein Pmar_PMAR003480 [Perkinsus marinus ATCC 50983]|uniref:Uncharacterized protein n=1 Tax=Perkinsus marinus (strain ATCC 50983 / TXsc) TaxID=423536 RepID=C5KHF6_PERM5|nr:hypothetical protein Pmar_PMAR003480 [Perkinsus marinus ATCC 50983]EER16018.1 hypothetical protein Pmar_PMAR003480 [Perkinsus marinus ATCC 50983]|eukprot:XP_002784222.1 hypothetical protein Pmar_PMAR003480 [Perkinsus marinus ATCC 50983]
MADQTATNNQLESMRRAILHLQQENRLLKDQLHRTCSSSTASSAHGGNEPSDPPFDLRRRSLELLTELDTLEKQQQSTNDRLVNHRISGIKAILARHQSMDESDTVIHELAQRRSSIKNSSNGAEDDDDDDDDDDEKEEEDDVSGDHEEPRFDMRRLSSDLESEIQALRALSESTKDRLINQRLTSCEQVLARQQEIEDFVKNGHPKGCFLTKPIMNVHS